MYKGIKEQKWTGRRFGRLLALDEPLPETRVRKSGSYTLWKLLCLCDCGTKRLFNIYDLASGKSKSCGCLRREWRKTHGKKTFGQHAPALASNKNIS